MNRQNRQNRHVNPGKESPSSGWWRGLGFPLLLLAIMAVLFAKSFLPDYVHFSNDGPLGEQHAEKIQMPGVLTGIWDDLNDLGNAGGTAAPDISALGAWILQPVGNAKFFAAIALFILGMSAWVFFRQLKFSPLAAALGGLAAALNSSYFGNSCWGDFPQQIAMAMVFLALALVMANSGETRALVRWTRLALAGMAVGFSVMEGADNGAIFSIFVAAFVFFKSLIEDTAPAVARVGRGIGRVAFIAIFAAFIAAQTITSLVETFIVGTAGTDPGTGAKDSLAHWDWATQWSLPKKETLGVFVPGLFGYRMDTPKDMMDFLRDHYNGGEYWGGMGRTPEIDRFFDSGQTGSPPSGPADWMRFGYGGYYCGIFVALVAFFAIAQSFRRENSIFPIFERRLIWFWLAALIVALLVSWGRFGPFDGWPYSWLYKLPGASTVRNPAKLMAIFYLAMAIMFAYGVDGLSRRYMQTPAGRLDSSFAQLKTWWASVRGFDRNWTLYSMAAFAVCFLAWIVYSGEKPALIHYLGKVGFSDPDTAGQIASFSIGQVGWFLLFFAAAVILVVLVLSEVFSGKRGQLGGVLLGALLVADLGRANLPWIIHWNYLQKYEIDPSDHTKSTNPIINLLSDKPYEHRVADLQSDSPFEQLYRIEWMQHQFPYYNVQCLDIIQSPRVASDLAAYDIALAPTSSSLYRVARRWELSNTSYLLGPAAYLDSLNQQLDPAQRRFKIVQRFRIIPKPGIDQPTELEQITAILDTNGDYALFEFGGALPRAKLYSDWQVSTNQDTTLQTLASQDFNPRKTVLVSEPLPDTPANNSRGENAGTVDFKSYSPKDIVLAAQATAPSVLLLNDKFDPNWHVRVDGKPVELFRANFIMRGVFLPAGAHTVEFRFSLPSKPLYITVIALCVGIVLSGFLFVSTRRPQDPTDEATGDYSAKLRRASAGKINPSSEAVRSRSQ